MNDENEVDFLSFDFNKYQKNELKIPNFIINEFEYKKYDSEKISYNEFKNYYKDELKNIIEEENENNSKAENISEREKIIQSNINDSENINNNIKDNPQFQEKFVQISLKPMIDSCIEEIDQIKAMKKFIDEKLMKEKRRIEEAKKQFLINNNSEKKMTMSEKLKSSAENYSKLKDKIEMIYNKVINNDITLKILQYINEIINQSNNSNEGHIIKQVEKMNKVLEEIEVDIKDKELYLFICDSILKLIFKKIESYSVDTKKNKFFIFAKFLNLCSNKVLIGLFIQKIAFNCPYIIPDFSKQNKDYSNEYIQKMECYEYLFFCFLYCEYNKNIPLINEFMENIKNHNEIKLFYGVSFKVFINVFGKILFEDNKQKLFDTWSKVKTDLNNEIKKNRNEKNNQLKVIIESTNNETIYGVERCLEYLKNGKTTELYQ